MVGEGWSERGCDDAECRLETLTRRGPDVDVAVDSLVCEC